MAKLIFFLFLFFMAVSICTLNVNGIAEFTKQEKVFNALQQKQFDIYLLQETHLPDVETGKLWEKQWGGRALWSPGTTRSAGVGLLVNPQSTVEITKFSIDTDGRVLTANAKSHNNTLQIINVYAPSNPSDRETLF